jgi:hypothetical protein
MSEKRSTLQEDIARDVLPEGEDRKIESYSVVLDSIRSEIETMDSFALKFSVLLKIPVTKVKHMVRRLPCTLWRGKSLSKAKMLVELAGEAGGNARVVENEETPRASEGEKPKKGDERTVCSKCGFPLKQGEEFCNFCMTSVKDQAGRRSSAPVVEKNPQIPPARLFFYIVLVLIAVILAFVLR